MLDEMERSMHDAICVVKRVLESKTVVPGGGAVEAALSIYLENFATSLVSELFVVLFFSLICQFCSLTYLSWCPGIERAVGHCRIRKFVACHP